MPELPEVETTLRGLAPHIQNTRIDSVVIRCQQLRWPIPSNLSLLLENQIVRHISRRAKYLLVQFDTGTLIIHLGMSGRLCFLTAYQPPQRHDHVDIIFENQGILRYTDPRRFGSILWTEEDPSLHPLLKNLGVEPLTDAFTVDYLLKRINNRRVAIKSFIMDSCVVVGVGNIYAAEALFMAKIHPELPVNLMTPAQGGRLVAAIKQILTQAIAKGGTTLKDFVNSEGRPGYFSQELNVYGRAGLPCVICSEPLHTKRLGQRSTVYCARCQRQSSGVIRL